MYGSTSEKPALARGTGQHVLVIVGDSAVAEVLTATLELADYQVSLASTGTEALERLTEHRFELMVVDVALPDLEDIGRAPRPVVAHRPPVLFLTEYDSLGRILPELGLGERDYVTKPFRVAEVLARMQVLLRGPGSARPEGGLHYRDLVLDDARCQARRGVRALDLTPAEYRLLRHLLVNAHRVLSKEQISRYVWGDFHGDNAIEQLVSRLRRKVDRDAPVLIHTRRGFGYWLGRADAEV
ncbi:response regulator transcription factor [Streptomyces sp. NPDC002928]|uniref:response regulator transcription factor n=1 Tax=Streptomyces sp. NPDC002928 TaxID=3154440 RepID=UPI0033B50DC4